MSADLRARIAERAARELRPGEIVNLGIGIPNLIPGFLGPDTEVFLHTENGLLGVGPRVAGSIDIGPRGLIHFKPFIASTSCSPVALGPAFFTAS